MTDIDKNKELNVWDFTLSNKNNLDINILKDTLCEVSKHWALQLEKGETGYIHWQGRFSLMKRKRLGALIKLFKLYEQWDEVHFSPTANANTKNFNYVMKADTRIDGPWTDKDEEKFETKQLQIFKGYKMYPWQKTLENKATDWCPRKIDMIYDTVGNQGKSIFSEYLEYTGVAEEIPPFRMMDDIFQWVASRPKKQCYIIDMPRALKKDKLADFYAGIEIVKNGVCYDKRYKAVKKRFDRPRIFVFTNTLPNFNFMSPDRWVVWEINQKKILQKWDPKGANICHISDDENESPLHIGEL